jgi:transposase, IS5 family
MIIERNAVFMVQTVLRFQGDVMSQLSFSDVEYGAKRKKTKREIFLAEMDSVVPWDSMIKLIEPVYPKSAVGRPAYALPSMLRVYCMQQWYGLSDPAMEEALYEIASMRRFAGFSLGSGSVPDETTILNFRHLLEANKLTEHIFALINQYLLSKGLRLSKGTIVDATIIEAPCSTKNATGTRDPEMHQTKKGNNWHFGMKAHIGVDAETGLCIVFRRRVPMCTTLPLSKNFSPEKRTPSLQMLATVEPSGEPNPKRLGILRCGLESDAH